MPKAKKKKTHTQKKKNPLSSVRVRVHSLALALAGILFDVKVRLSAFQPYFVRFPPTRMHSMRRLRNRALVTI